MLLSKLPIELVALAYAALLLSQGVWLSALLGKIAREDCGYAKTEKTIELVVMTVVFIFIDVILLLARFKVDG